MISPQVTLIGEVSANTTYQCLPPQAAAWVQHAAAVLRSTNNSDKTFYRNIKDSATHPIQQHVDHASVCALLAVLAHCYNVVCTLETGCCWPQHRPPHQDLLRCKCAGIPCSLYAVSSRTYVFVGHSPCGWPPLTLREPPNDLLDVCGTLVFHPD